MPGAEGFMTPEDGGQSERNRNAAENGAVAKHTRLTGDAFSCGGMETERRWKIWQKHN